jgi:hypothetical protein
LRYFLPISTHVLHGRSADRAGDAGEALDSGAVRRDSVRYQAIPVFSGCCRDDETVAFPVGGDAGKSDAKHKTGKAAVGNEQVAATAQDEERDPTLSRKGNAGNDIVFALRLREPASGPADLERGVGGKRNLLKDLHFATRVSGGVALYALAKPKWNLYNQTDSIAKEQACTPRLC